ncbi:MAG: hypothetical protein EOM26_09065 [Alphaproteobacteria bacterium]|nr:hypothetical protein [Alphaproteobacteria bacterium]
MTHLRRFAPTAPAEWPWNGWPNAGGIAGRMSVEQVAEWRGMRMLSSCCKRVRATRRISAGFSRASGSRTREASSRKATSRRHRPQLSVLPSKES